MACGTTAHCVARGRRRLAKRERQHVVDVIRLQYAGIQVSLLSTQPSGPVRSGLLGRLFEDLTGTQRDSCQWVSGPRPDLLFLLDNPAQRNRRSCDGWESSVTLCLSRQRSLRGDLPAQAGHLFRAKSWTRRRFFPDESGLRSLRMTQRGPPFTVILSRRRRIYVCLSATYCSPNACVCYVPTIGHVSCRRHHDV